MRQIGVVIDPDSDFPQPKKMQEKATVFGTIWLKTFFCLSELIRQEKLFFLCNLPFRFTPNHNMNVMIK